MRVSISVTNRANCVGGVPLRSAPVQKALSTCACHCQDGDAEGKVRRRTYFHRVSSSRVLPAMGDAIEGLGTISSDEKD